MHWIETKITLTTPSTETVLDLVANCFFDLGLKGVVIEDPKPLEREPDWIADVSQSFTEWAVIGFFKEDDTFTENSRQLEIAVEKVLSSYAPTRAQTSYRRIDEKDWSHSWKTYFKPISIGAQIVIKPSWCDYTARKGEQILELDPGMAFGTGTHPTTVMCVEMIDKRLFPGDTLLDIGTGTGVLLIAAALLGAAGGCGVDNDPMAVAIARQNLARNRVDPALFKVRQSDLTTAISQPSAAYDLIVANILASTVKRLAPDIDRLLAPKGFFIASGLLVKDEKEMTACFQKQGLITSARLQQEEWLCLAAQRAA